MIGSALRSAALVFLAACAAPPPTEADPHHRTTMVALTDRGFLPAGEIRVPAMATVVFQNRTQNAVAITVLGAACPACDTVLGFSAALEGARTEALPPGSIASLCFHEPGHYPFRATTAGGSVRQGGTLRVEASR